MPPRTAGKVTASSRQAQVRAHTSAEVPRQTLEAPRCKSPASLVGLAWATRPFEQRKQLHSVQGTFNTRREPVTFQKHSSTGCTGLPNSFRGTSVLKPSTAAQGRLTVTGDVVTLPDGSRV